MRKILIFAPIFILGLSACGATYRQQATNISQCAEGDKPCMLTNPRGWSIDGVKLTKLREKLRLKWVLGGEHSHHAIFEPGGLYRMTYYDVSARRSAIGDPKKLELVSQGPYTYDPNHSTIVGWDLVKNVENDIIVIDRLTPYSLWVHELNDPTRQYRFKVRAVVGRELVK